MNIFLYVENDGVIYAPAVAEEITLTWERVGTPGKLTFSVLKDDVLNFTEGNAVSLHVGEHNMFYGFVFSKERNDLTSIEVTCYDQLRYLKNTDSIRYENKTAAELICLLADDFRLNLGEIADTRHVIPYRIEKDKTLFDVIAAALSETTAATGETYVLYDDFSRLTLKNIADMRLDTIVDSESSESFSYKSDIDTDTYNQVAIAEENKDTGTDEIHIARDGEHINQWGVLQLYERSVGGAARADGLLRLYNRKKRTLTVSGVFGDVRVRAGSLLPVCLDLGDMLVNNYMLCEKIAHKFENERHIMDITLSGGDFSHDAI